jgi:cell volume regulation protein A
MVAAGISLAVVLNRGADWMRIPAPAIFLIGAAVASDLVPAWGRMAPETVQRIVTVALIVILFDGGMSIGWRRFRSAAGVITWIGVAGTFVTAGAAALLTHVLFALSWPTALLIGTALAPTDPAVVFSVLGRRQIPGRASTILEGESGANDPVGIALMAALLVASQSTGWDAVGTGVAEFFEQMLIGGAAGVAGGFALSWFMRRVHLPSEGLYPVRTLGASAVIYGVTTLLGGSGFLAVFLAGILVGDLATPFKAEIRRFHASLASLGEIVAFTVLGLTVSLKVLPDGSAWQIGLAVAALIAFVVRPIFVGLLLIPVRLSRPERLFVLWSGLKGAVPILLGTFVLSAGVADGGRIYGVIFVAVAFSVIVQGGLVPWVATRLRLPMRLAEPRPWAIDVRFSHEPQALRPHVVAAGSAAAGARLDEIHRGGELWISLVIRQGELVAPGPDATLRPGDVVLAIGDGSVFARPAPTTAQ